MKRDTRNGKHTRKLVLWIGLAVVAGFGLALVSRTVSSSPGRGVPGRVESATTEFKRIGFPYADKVAVQHFDLYGATEPTSMTVEFVSPDGTLLQSITEPAFPSESSRLFTGPGDPKNPGRLKYEDAVGGGSLMAGVNLVFRETGNDAYLGMALLDSVALTQPGAYTHVLMQLVKNAFGWNSAFVLQNISETAEAAVYLSFYDYSGNPVCSEPITLIPAAGSVWLDLDSFGCLEDGFQGSAVVQADQPVAVSTVYSYNTARGLSCSYGGVDSWGTDSALAVPALFNAYDLQTSTLCVMNVGSETTDVHVEYSDGVTSDAAMLSPFTTACFPQAAEEHATGWAGAAIVSNSNYVNLAAAVNVMAHSGGALVGCWAYTATPLSQLRQNEQNGSGRSMAFPFLVNNHEGWTSEIHLYNPTGASLEITPRYVLGDDLGHFVYCAEPFTVPPGGMISISQSQLPSFFSQSMAYFNTTGPVAATVSGTSSEPLGTTDRHFGYEALSLGEPIQFPDTCSTMHRIFVPLVNKWTP